MLQAQANKVVGAPVLLTSPQQLRRILYDQLKLDAKLNVPLTMQGGGKSTSEPVVCAACIYQFSVYMQILRLFRG